MDYENYMDCTLDGDKFLSKRTLFVPELVKVHPIPASVWREVQMVPFVLERLSSVIKIHHFMETLRSTIGEQVYSLTNQTVNKIPPSFSGLTDKSGHGSPRALEIFDVLEAVTLKGTGSMSSLHIVNKQLTCQKTAVNFQNVNKYLPIFFAKCKQ